MGWRRYPRVVLVLALALACALLDHSVGRAETVDGAPDGDQGAQTERPKERGFWVRLGALHYLEVEVILAHVQDIEGYLVDAPPVVAADAAARAALIADAREMLGHAEAIAPDDPRIRAMRALVEERAGQAARARAIYDGLFERRYVHPLSDRSCLRYGLLEGRTGAVDRALEVLEACVRRLAADGSITIDVYRDTVMSLAHLYAHQDRIDDAIGLLEGYHQNGLSAVFTLALAALYDRDGRISDALAILEEGRRAHADRFGPTVARELVAMEMVPAEERYYILAFLFEISGSWAEAREMWRFYLASEPREGFARRAREHLDAVDLVLAGAGGPGR